MLNKVISVSQEAGKILKDYIGRVQGENKLTGYDPKSVVSEADLAAESLILEHLQKLFPTHNFFSEEAGMHNVGSEYTWYIDPLDGTSNFLREIPLFGVSIGLLHGRDPILGVLHFPLLDLTVYAEKGQGATANGKTIHVSNRPLERSLYYGRGYYGGELCLDQELGKYVGMLKIFDTSAYELASIAMGKGEIYVLDSVLHDVVAGVVIVREAGGKVTDFQGEEWTADAATILATNGCIHDEVLKLREYGFM